MTLQSSGTISISDINVELNRSSVATTNLNDTVVRRLAGVPSGQISMSNFYGKTYIPYWHSGFAAGGSLYMYGESATVLPSTGDLFITGYQVANTSNYQVFTTKINKYGDVQWQRFLGDPSADLEQGFDIAVDGSGNTYITGKSGPNTNSDIFVAKYNSVGALQWQRKIDSANNFDTTSALAIDGSSNVYIAGFYNATSGGRMFVSKFDTNGNLQWFKTYNATDSMDIAQALTIDSSGNIYVAGVGTLQSSYFAGYALKLDSAGNVIWGRKWDKSISNDWFYDVALDSSGNVYFAGKSELAEGGNQSFGVLVKYNSSGVLQWQRQVYAGLANGTRFDSVGVDSSGNVYGMGQGGSSSLQMVVKYDTNGNIQWQRTLNGFGPRGGCVINDRIHLVHGGSTTTFTSALPIDGSLTGSYSLVISESGNGRSWQASSYTDSAGTGTDASITVTATTVSVTATTATFTDSAANVPYGVLII